LNDTCTHIYSHSIYLSHTLYLSLSLSLSLIHTHTHFLILLRNPVNCTFDRKWEQSWKCILSLSLKYLVAADLNEGFGDILKWRHTFGCLWARYVFVVPHLHAQSTMCTITTLGTPDLWRLLIICCFWCSQMSLCFITGC